MFTFDLDDSYGDSVSLVTTFRPSGMVRMYVGRDDADRQVANAGGGGYDKRGTCLADFLTASFQPELTAIAKRADHAYLRNAAGELIRDERAQRADSLYGMAAYRNGRKVERVRLDGGCGWESIVRVAEAIGLRISYVAETKEAYIHEVHGLDKLRAKRAKAAAKVAQVQA